MRFLQIFLLSLAVPFLAFGQTTFAVGGHVGNFDFAVSNYYGVPEREVTVIRERRLPEEDVPVVLFLAQQARVAPASIVNLRISGKSWWDIAVHYGIGPEAFYVPVEVIPGPPYGKAWGHYKNKHRKEWRTIVLDDRDIVTLVNVRFLADYHATTPDRIIAYLPTHPDFLAVHAELARGRFGDTVMVGDDQEREGKEKHKYKEKYKYKHKDKDKDEE